jgi:hypothetical protein
MKEFPSVEKMADYVRNHEKRVGMRMIYREFGITEPEDREKMRQLWDAFHVKLPDAYGKEIESSGETETVGEAIEDE